jgi:SAM-dependent methyltransferase
MAHDQEGYWSRVGQAIGTRTEHRLTAGYENPYLEYKRARFLGRFLDTVDVDGKDVLELGQGPGGNLKHLAERRRPRRLFAADISETMCRLAAENLRDLDGSVEIHKIDGRTLPFADRSVDTSFTATVLHHVTDGEMFLSLVSELCRVTRDEIVVMEDIGTSDAVGGSGSYVGRTVRVYEAAFADRGFVLSEARFLGTLASRLWGVSILRLYRALNRRHHEGERIPRLLSLAMAAPLPFTKRLDDVLPDRWDLAKLVFRRAPAS